MLTDLYDEQTIMQVIELEVFPLIIISLSINILAVLFRKSDVQMLSVSDRCSEEVKCDKFTFKLLTVKFLFSLKNIL